jgi:hypothetical protein
MKGIGWPYELAWDISELKGANGRMMLATAMRAVEDRQDLLRPFAKRAVGYACMKAINLGVLKPSEDWWRWGFTMPARMTADYGRDKSQDREDYLNGLTSLTRISAEQGIDRSQFIEELKEEREELEAAGLPLPMSPQQAQAEAAKQAAEAQGKQAEANLAKPEPVVVVLEKKEDPKPEPAPAPIAQVIQFPEAVAQLVARVKEGESLDKMCADLIERRKNTAP